MSERLRRLLAERDVDVEAAFAASAILEAAARSDGEVTAAERAAIARGLQTTLHLGPDAIRQVRELAEHRTWEELEVEAALVRDRWDPDQRRAVLRAVRDVVWADGELHAEEAKLTALVATLLGLPLAEVRDALAP